MAPTDSTATKPKDQVREAKKPDDQTTSRLSTDSHDLTAQREALAKRSNPETKEVSKANISKEGSITFYASPEAEAAKDKNVQVNAKGNVTEVTLPNGEKRSFGYDKSGALQHITEPNGRDYQKVHGKWVDGSGKPAPFENPVVSKDGDLSFTVSKDRRAITESHDGKTTALNPKDKSVVTYDADFHVTNVKYADGKSREFNYENGKLTSLTDTDGKRYELKEGKWLGPDGKDTLRSDVKVAPDGGYSFKQPDGKVNYTGSDGQNSRINPDGSVLHVDSNNRVKDITYPDGKKTQFDYDAQGNPNKLTTTNGSVFTLQDGKWLDANKKDSGISEVRVQNDGSFAFKYGNNEFVNSTHNTQTSFDRASIGQTVEQLKEAADHSTLWMFSTPQTDKVMNILEPMSAVQRQLVSEEYAKQNPGHDLLTDLKAKLSGPDAARAEALMKRQDGVADNTGQIHQAMAKLAEMGRPDPDWTDDNRVRAEKEIRDSLNTLTADQLKAVEAKYKQDYGRELRDDLQSNPNLSDESKKAIDIYLKGKDQRTDEDTLKLANMAIEKGRPDIFDEAFRDAPQSARDKFIAADGMNKIDTAFECKDTQIAKDFLQRGAVSLATIVDGDTHWYHTNKDDITRAVSNATEKDRTDFKRGEELALKHQDATNPEDKRALDFYNSVNKALGGAGNEREVDKWKGQLRNNEQVINNILDSHNDGGWFGIGSSTDKNKELSAVENMSEADWTYLRSHPDEVQKIGTALDHFSDSHKDQVMSMLSEKLAQKDFATAQKVGNRSLSERLTDDKDNTGNRVDALSGMTDAERKAYLSNTNGYRDQINGLLQSDQERVLAQHLAGTTGDIKPSDKVLIDGLKNAEPTAVFRDIEAAFKADPTLKDRINNPQTPEDKQISQWYHDATHAAVDKAGLGDQYYGDGNRVPGEYDKFENSIFKDGHLPLDQQLRLTNDKQAQTDLILHASEAERTKLIDQNPDAATKAFQDSVLGTDPARKQVLQTALNQKDMQGNYGFLTSADQFRLYSLDGGNSEALQQKLAAMTPEQRQGLANEYFTKYHSLITNDVISKVPGDQQWRFRELLSPTDVGVQQVALDSQMNNDAHTSSWDKFLRDNWDSTRLSADSTQDNLNKFVADHSAELNRLTPDQRKQFDDAVSNYMQAQKAYIDSKGQFSEAFVDATITVAAIGGACFTGGTSLALLGAIGAGGALYRTAMMASIQGTDFDSSAGNILRQGFEGGTSAMLGFIGPGELGLGMSLKVGTEIAEKAAIKLAEGSTKALFKDGAEDIIKNELANLTRHGAVMGDKENAALAEKVAATGVDKAAVEQAIAKQIKQETLTGFKNIALHEGELYVKGLLAAEIGAQGKELAATALGFEDPNTLLERMKGAAVSTVAGVTMFHGLFRIASSGQYVKIALGKDPAGNIVAGEGTVVRRADGSLEPVVGKDSLVKLKPGDTIYEKQAFHENPDGSRQLVVGDTTTLYNPKGEVTEVSDAKTKARRTMDYVEDPVTHASVLDKVVGYKPNGTVDYSYERQNGVYVDSATGKPVGTDITYNPADGSITVKGSANGTEVGSSRNSKADLSDALTSITRFADGSYRRDYTDGVSLTYDHQNRPLEFTDVNKNVRKFEYGSPTGSDLSKLTINGQEYSKDSSGKWVDKNGDPFADSVTLNRYNELLTIENPSDKIRTPMNPNEPVKSIEYFRDGEIRYDYKNKPPATSDRVPPPEAPTKAEVLQNRIHKGDLVPQPDGTYVHDESNSRTRYDAKGDVIAIDNANRQHYDIARDANGDVTKITVTKNGKVESTFQRDATQPQFFEETDARGRHKAYYRDVRVDPDGSVVKLKFDPKMGPDDWTGTRERPDGLVAKIDKVGRETIEGKDWGTEHTRIESMIQKAFAGDPAREAQFKSWMHDFEANHSHSDEEVANTYYQLDKLMSSEGSVLPEAERMRLAEQFMYKTVNWHTIGQGYFGTCNVAAELEVRMMQRHPSAVIQMVTDVATTGKYITADGDIIDMHTMNNVMTPFRINGGDNNFDPKIYSGRDYFDQLFQSTAVETHWQTTEDPSKGIKRASTVDELRNGDTFHPGDLRYEFADLPGTKPTGEVINDYSTNPPSRYLKQQTWKTDDPLTGTNQVIWHWEPTASPELSGSDMLYVGHEILGYDEPPHMLGRDSDKDAINVVSADDLAQKLHDMQVNGDFPATVFVDTRDPLFHSGPGDRVDGYGGYHVISAQNVFQKNGKWYVEFTNQYDQSADHIGPGREVPVEDLYRAMEYRPPKTFDPTQAPAVRPPRVQPSTMPSSTVPPAAPPVPAPAPRAPNLFQRFGTPSDPSRGTLNPAWAGYEQYNQRTRETEEQNLLYEAPQGGAK
ncbi:MAG TPA: hypothetical protein V6C76_01730 [Drouetiella sp.]